MRFTIVTAAIGLPSTISLAAYFIMNAGGLGGYCGEKSLSNFDKNHMPTYVAGAAGELTLEVSYYDGKPSAIEFSRAGNVWPEGIEIEAGRWDASADSCNWAESLKGALNLRLWRASGWAETDHTNPTLHFLFTLPESMAGQELCFRAHWRGSPWGDLEARPSAFDFNRRFSLGKWKPDGSLPPAIMVVSVIAPCNEEDRQRARESHVFEAWLAGDSKLTLQLADSMLDSGWGSFSILMYAEGAARELGQLDRAVQLLDSSYQQYGRVGAPADSLTQRREYEKMRSNLLDQIHHRQR